MISYEDFRDEFNYPVNQNFMVLRYRPSEWTLNRLLNMCNGLGMTNRGHYINVSNATGIRFEARSTNPDFSTDEEFYEVMSYYTDYAVCRPLVKALCDDWLHLLSHKSANVLRLMRKDFKSPVYTHYQRTKLLKSGLKVGLFESYAYSLDYLKTYLSNSGPECNDDFLEDNNPKPKREVLTMPDVVTDVTKDTKDALAGAMSISVMSEILDQVKPLLPEGLAKFAETPLGLAVFVQLMKYLNNNVLPDEVTKVLESTIDQAADVTLTNAMSQYTGLITNIVKSRATLPTPE